jgi:hypothetical protein
MSRKTLPVVEPNDETEPDEIKSEIKSDETKSDAANPTLVWGAEAIGLVVDRKPEQVRRLYQAGFFKGAVWKAGHRTLVGSLPRLRNLGSF